jgi:hypothetical protein
MGFFRESVASTYFRKFCRNNKKEKKKEKKKNWDNSDVALLPRQNCPGFFFFFFFLKKKIIFKKKGGLFFQYKLVTCNFEEIKHGVDRSLRPGQTCRKRKKKVHTYTL